tara:strand:- start:193 stop:363 length:171 start_codon:yes stop_codon:yes gene_type:complete
MNFKNNFNMIWLLQLIASTSWIVSIFLYGSFAAGDFFQLIAASAWTIANIINFFKP